MPRVRNHTPPWLCRPSPGFDLFSPSPSRGKPSAKVGEGAQYGLSDNSPRRTLAYRGTEVFVVVGNELRWSDLVMLSEKGKPARVNGRSRASSRRAEESPAGSYRVLRVPFSGQITRLSISPSKDYMAIATSHTVHIAVLPDSSHLGVDDFGPLRLKTFQLGPTAHVLEQSALASIIWHPLGVNGRTLVTVTEDATVRLWEVNRDNRSSFDEPALSVDLKKLANATTAEEDLRASKYGMGKGFTPDSAELEVTAACFGRNSDVENGCLWPSMTLWIATTEGDLYALCPLLPSKWQLRTSDSQPKGVAALAASIRARSELILKNDEATENEKRAALQQRQWLSELLELPPTRVDGKGDFDYIDIYPRPKQTPAVPRLQGPFQMTPELDEEDQVIDIFVTALRDASEEDFVDLEDPQKDDEDALASIICLSTTDGIVRVCLDLEGVEAKWLPSIKGLSSMFERTLRLSTSRSTPTQRDGYLVSEDDSRPLLLIETISLQGEEGQEVAPLFTSDTRVQHGVFVTLETGIFYLSLASWAKQLSEELGATHDEGAEFRLKGFLDYSRTLIQTIIKFPEQMGTASPSLACIVLEDSDLGYFILSGTDGQPLAATLDIPDSELMRDAKPTELPDLESLHLNEPRQLYHPPQVFWQESRLMEYYNKEIPARQKRAFAEEIKLSPAALDVLTKAHSILSHETHQLGLAASDLFRKCERLQMEFRRQLQVASQIAHRIDRITGDDEEDFGEDEDNLVGNEKMEQRLQVVRSRQDELTSRYEALKMKLAKAGGLELGKNERAWVEEVKTLNTTLNPPEHGVEEADADEDEEDEKEKAIWRRLEYVKRVQKELVMEAQKEGDEDEGASTATGTVRVPQKTKKQKMEKVMQLLERENTLIKATGQRLERLKTDAQTL